MIMPESDLEKGYFAIRNSVALEEETDLRCLSIKGKEAFKLLDQICPCNVFLQNGQMRHTLLLDEHAVPFADVYVCRDGEDAYLLGYCNSSANLIDWMKQHKGQLSDFSIADLNVSNCFLTLNGPYAWELCANAVGTEILGMPYLSIMCLKFGIIFRAGITGEYGYHLMVPSDQKERWIKNLINIGSDFDMVLNGKTARAQCTLENFFFDLNREGQYELTPQELQLQWRLSRQKKEYPGYRVIQALGEKGWDRRVTLFKMNKPVSVNDRILYKSQHVGLVLSVGYSPQRKEYLGKALINRPYWYAGLDCFRINNQKLETISAPAIDNLSTRVNPNLDSYFKRKKDTDETVQK